MSLKEQFLNIDTYDDYKEKENVFKDLNFSDPQVISHYMKLLNNEGVPKKNAFYKDGVHIDRINSK